MNRLAAVVSILGTAIVQFLWQGLVHGVLLRSMEEQAFSIYSSVMHPLTDQPPMALWYLVAVIGTWYLLYVIVRKPGPIVMRDAVISGVMLFLATNIIYNISMYMYFVNFPVNMALIGTGVDLITGALTGAVLAVLYNAIAKRAS